MSVCEGSWSGKTVQDCVLVCEPMSRASAGGGSREGILAATAVTDHPALALLLCLLSCQRTCEVLTL